MKKGLLALYCLVGAALLSAQTSQNVVFGEWARYFEQEEGLVRVFLDRHGDFYPNSVILEADLQERNASLREYYAAHPAAFSAVAQEYGVSTQAAFDEAFAAFQSSIVADLLRQVNALDEQSDLFFLIHGFRKPMLPQRGGSPSSRGYAAVRASIQESYAARSRRAVFVEVYWDGTYDCCIGRKTKVNKRIFKLFEDVAQINASEVGYGLRRLVSAVDRQELSIVTHSLGAQVGLSLLTNTYDERIAREEQALPTPPQEQLNVCFLAPAISRAPFEEYHERTTDTDPATEDNYQLSILYNEKDFVLKKRWKIFGPGPKKYGNTSLGCNCRKEADKLQAHFSETFPNSALTLYDANIGATHRFVRYARAEAFGLFLESVLK